MGFVDSALEVAQDWSGTLKTMARQRVILTYKDYEALPPDGRRYELHDGELSVTPAPSPRHQRILRNLSAIIWQHVRTRGLGELLFAPIDCILSETTVVQPDLAYLDTTRGSSEMIRREPTGSRRTPPWTVQYSETRPRVLTSCRRRRNFRAPLADRRVGRERLIVDRQRRREAPRNRGLPWTNSARLSYLRRFSVVPHGR